jgi:hypothetical protein
MCGKGGYMYEKARDMRGKGRDMRGKVGDMRMRKEREKYPAPFVAYFDDNQLFTIITATFPILIPSP